MPEINRNDLAEMRLRIAEIQTGNPKYRDDNIDVLAYVISCLPATSTTTCTRCTEPIYHWDGTWWTESRSDACLGTNDSHIPADTFCI